MKRIVPVLFAIVSAAGAAMADPVTVTKGSDGSESGQFRNPSKVTIVVDPAVTYRGQLYLQTQTYTIPVLAAPGQGWKAVKAIYFNPAGQKVEISLDGPVGNRQITIDTLPRPAAANTVTVRFATLRLKPSGTPDFIEDVTISATAVPDLDTVDLDGDGIPDGWERRYFDTKDIDSVSPDADGDMDGLDNLHEFSSNTSPSLKDNPAVGLKATVTIK